MHTGVQRNGFEMKLSKTRKNFQKSTKKRLPLWKTYAIISPVESLDVMSRLLIEAVHIGTESLKTQ